MKDMQDRLDEAEANAARANDLSRKLIAENDVLVERLARQDERIAELEMKLKESRGGAGP